MKADRQQLSSSSQKEKEKYPNKKRRATWEEKQRKPPKRRMFHVVVRGMFGPSEDARFHFSCCAVRFLIALAVADGPEHSFHFH